MAVESTYLLIIACSQRKRSDPGLLPAIDRYNGPQFQVLRKFLREYPAKAQLLDTYILSAKFGLVAANHLIGDYDLRMTLKQSRELHSQVLPKLKDILHNNHYDELFLNLGHTYLQALIGYEQIVPNSTKVFISQGSQGRRQAELQSWLGQNCIKSPENKPVVTLNDRVYLRGIEIKLTREQVFQLARQSLNEGNGNIAAYHSSYVLVDGQRVAPKWLVSQLTGLPVGAFHTGDAKRVLQQLGVEVRRV
jgi:hypothetical protein